MCATVPGWPLHQAAAPMRGALAQPARTTRRPVQGNGRGILRAARAVATGEPPRTRRQAWTVNTRGYGKGGGFTAGWIPLLACGAGKMPWVFLLSIG